MPEAGSPGLKSLECIRIGDNPADAMGRDCASGRNTLSESIARQIYQAAVIASRIISGGAFQHSAARAVVRRAGGKPYSPHHADLVNPQYTAPPGKIARSSTDKSKTNIILQGDALDRLKAIADKAIDCVVTSPPYWTLRDYGVAGQLGQESTMQEYIHKLCAVFDEVKRVLKPTGTCWVNLGDTYASSNLAPVDGRF